MGVVKKRKKRKKNCPEPSNLIHTFTKQGTNHFSSQVNTFLGGAFYLNYEYYHCLAISANSIFFENFGVKNITSTNRI